MYNNYNTVKACLRFLCSYWLLLRLQTDWQLAEPITVSGAPALGVATRSSFSWLFRPFQLVVITTILFNRDNMATAARSYYSEDGRATKRQKTDGMATVGFICVSCSGD